MGSQYESHRFMPYLVPSTPVSPASKAIKPILYMWSAMLSGPSMPIRIQPVLFVVCRSTFKDYEWRPRKYLRSCSRSIYAECMLALALRFCDRVRKSIARAALGCPAGIVALVLVLCARVLLNLFEKGKPFELFWVTSSRV